MNAGASLLALLLATAAALLPFDQGKEGPAGVPDPYPGSVKYCEDHVLGPPGGPQINWTGYYTGDPLEKVRAHYLKVAGSRNHEKLSGTIDIWRFPADRPEYVLEVRHPKDPLPGGNCLPIPAKAGALVIISRIFRPA